MRRVDREIKDRYEIDSIIRKAKVCRLALSDDGRPYIIPLCFGYEGNKLYFHCAAVGRKLDILRRNACVCFEMDIDQELVRPDRPCGCSMKYRSIVGFGKARSIQDMAAKRSALDAIMLHYGLEPCEYPESILDKTTIIEVEIEDLTGKKSGY